VCPFVNANDPRCSAHLTLTNIRSALAHCANRYSECPVYHQLLAEKQPHVSKRLSPATTAAG